MDFSFLLTMYLGIYSIIVISIMENSEKKTTVALSEETKEQLSNFGKKGESFDSILQRVMSNTDSLCNQSENENSEDEEE